MAADIPGKANQKNWEEERARLLVAERATRLGVEAERRLVGEILDGISDGFLLLNHDWQITYVNKSGQALCRKSREELLSGRTVWELFPETVGTIIEQEYRQVMRDKVPARFEVFYEPYEQWHEIHAQPFRNGISICLQQITERKRQEQSVIESEQQYHLLFNLNPQPMWLIDIATRRFLAVNDAAVYHYGYTREEFLAMTILDLFPPAQAAAADKTVRDSMRPGQIDLVFAGIWKHRKKDGTVIDVEITWSQIFLRGKFARLVLANDVTERKRAEEALRSSEARIKSLFENMPVGLCQFSPEGEIIAANPALVQMLGYASEAELKTVNALSFFAGVEERQNFLDELERSGRVHNVEYVFTRKDGRDINVLKSARAIRSGTNEVLYLEATIIEITERKQLGDQLRQSQKMEAVGRLAGGIAHDFNNLMTLITGYGQMLMDDLPLGDPARDVLEEVLSAAARAASLTRQLLIFSRKHVVQPVVLDLNDVVAGIDKMLRRLTGDDIELRLVLAPDLWPVKADHSQLEQILMNLIVNARDAMPGGGVILIETANTDIDLEFARSHPEIAPGPYVVLTVSDEGLGMDAVTLTHIFEPFFTTKEQGQGTGLGLSIVYGIVKQSGGYISAASEPDKGTRFYIYLPRVEGPLEASRPMSDRSLSSGAETVLLVEDEDKVRKLVKSMLVERGYTVLEARTGDSAQDVVRDYAGSIQMLVTDVIMPGVNGHELAGRMKRMLPGLKVLYISGYGDAATMTQKILEEKEAFIQKPFTADTLARKVRETLDGG